ncbi:DHH family phosphoesterase [Methylomonas koyamae]|uniref:DHH family phosphoesterase n=2 Tax=Methylomonas koyamae TaxID=702114 RepID=UPI001C32C7E7|nr:DHH family phosphoesterase [Methylomonas koyamae]BBL57788.1 acetyltransferase [Methylomonas koyamae]
MNIDVFNGDADGICSLIQLRLAYPRESLLVTGVKRDIGLLTRVEATPGDEVVVLDVSLDRNRDALMRLLDKGVGIFYMDHHFPGEIPCHSGLTAEIDTDANVCTSLLMDRFLGACYTAWAVTGAFGDNLDATAYRAAGALNMSAQELHDLKQLGICINYNAYGDDICDLHIPPDLLYKELVGYRSPLEFIGDKPHLYRQLLEGYAQDMDSVAQVQAYFATDSVAVFVLPDQKWARRVSGVWGNELANRYPDRAHAVLNRNRNGGFQVSVRAPLNNKAGADELCRQFSGGGRKAAAGIDNLRAEYIDNFISAFQAKYS